MSHSSAAQLSSFTFLQLLLYAGMQVPVGVLLDASARAARSPPAWC